MIKKWLLLLIFICPLMHAGELVRGVSTDRAFYEPLQLIAFSLELKQQVDQAAVAIRYFHLGDVIAEEKKQITQARKFEWSWTPPHEDFKGYLVSIIVTTSGISDSTTIAVDVSSDWARFPRYGFVSKFPYLNTSEIQAVIENLNRYHINGLQFYDWHYKHHQPLKGTGEHPASTWQDIANRTIYFSTVNRYIDIAHSFGMKTMAYNLLYGAWSGFEADGVSPQWQIFLDPACTKPFWLDFSDSWSADIYMMNPANPEWQNYLFDATDDVFTALPFDGWHVDQLGDWGSIYAAGGSTVDLENSFGPFLQAAKERLDVPLVMNAVNQYGQRSIASAPVEFLYTEIWPPNDSYADVASIINRNRSYSGQKLNTVLAAYMNYDLSGKPGNFNEPGVLLADAVIFAAGGAHLELGEHMLCHEYFPNSNLAMPLSLRQKLVSYYDFLVAYQNLLRDGAVFEATTVTSPNVDIALSAPKKNALWSFAKSTTERKMVHFINFSQQQSLKWRDADGTHPEPPLLQNLLLTIQEEKGVSRIWVAVPDEYGCPQDIAFTQRDGEIDCVLPSLKYWTMLVLEYGDSVKVGRRESAKPEQTLLSENYPNPFNSSTTISFELPRPAYTELNIYDVQGRRVDSLLRSSLSPGRHKINWTPAPGTATGAYFCALKVDAAVVYAHQMIYNK